MISLLRTTSQETDHKTTIKQADQLITFMIIGLWVFGIGISIHYDTWTLGLGMGTLLMVIHLIALRFFPAKLFSRLIGASVMAFYMVQYLAQLHGLYEMHFWFFIMPMFLIIYQDWRVYIPFALIIVVHHVSIYVLVVIQGKNEFLPYFINMSELTNMTFFYHMGLAVLGVVTAAAVSFRLQSQTKARNTSASKLEDQLNEMKALALNVQEVASRITNKASSNNSQSVNEALISLGEEFNNIIDNIIVETNSVVKNAGQEGNLSARMTITNKYGVWQDLATSINELLETVSEPVVQINYVASNMSKGVLTDRISTTSKGAIKELFQNLNTALDNLKLLMQQVSNGINKIEEATSDMLISSEEMDSSTNEIATAIARMSTGAHNQLQDIEKTSNVIEMILASAQEMEADAASINTSAHQGFETSEEGKRVVEVVVNDIERIEEFSSKTMNSINVLSHRSTEIAQMLNVINEIATQTNLLALNASIEAAQAGDNGRGFAVVADEIKKLAESARSSTQQIEKIVRDVQSDTLEAAKVITEMNKNVISGVESTKKTHAMLSTISDGSKHTLDLSHKIKQISETQTKRISEVFNSIESVLLISEQAATGAEEVASSASQLSSGMKDFNSNSKLLKELGQSLKQSMNNFTLE